MKRGREGFAMLYVLLMAGIVAIMLYQALPRAAFEAERDKEQSLVDRGEQYKRAIQLYVRQNKRWPAKIEDLENTNGKRFLRKRYIDPMTGKDEWRPIHVGPGGVLTDSLIKQKGTGSGSTFNNTFITELGGVGGLPDAGNAGAINPGLRKRPSDLGPDGTGGAPGGGAGAGDPTLGGGSPVATNAPPGGQTNGGQPTGNQPAPPPPGGSASTGTSGQPSNTVAYGGISVLGGIGGGYSTAAGANGSTQPPMPGTLQGQGTGVPGGAAGGSPGGVNGASPSAAQMIQGLLTTPRPGGAPNSGFGGSGQVQGGGIAGFASKYEGEGIKVYNEQTEIQKWEFVYDMSKDSMLTGGQQLPQLGQNNQNNTNNSNPANNQTPWSSGQGSVGQGAFGQSTPAGTGTTSTTGH
jgi:type II secretory pathway pseudopilin PulG